MIRRPPEALRHEGGPGGAREQARQGAREETILALNLVC